MSSLTLRVLGPPRLERDGQPVVLPLRRALALLIYLAITDQPQSRETLAALLWSESEEGEARSRLRRTLHRLGEAVNERLLIADASTVRLSPESNLWVDALAFRRLAAAGLTSAAEKEENDNLDPAPLSPLTQAAGLYADDFLAGFTLPDSPSWDEWQFHQREGLRQICARVLEALARTHLAHKEWDDGIGAARRWLALDPLHEPAHRALMTLYARAGQHAAAFRQYQECVRILDAELGVSPDEETTRLYDDIRTRRLAPSAGEERPPAFVSTAAVLPERHSLPFQPTPFFGRAREVATLRQLLVDEPSCRLVTLVGPGGIGKTRLALAAATNVSAHFAHGVAFAPLAPIGSPDQIVFALADHLGVRFSRAGDAKQQLFASLRGKHQLLVVDNFEHLVDGATILTEILVAAPRVKLLVTSRERLHLSGEAVFTVGGLDVPDTPSQPAALDCGAVRLLMHRARLMRPDLEVGDDALDPIVRICRLVQGMPLALELAAGWLEALSFGEIADEIARGLDLLEGQTRDLPARQRSVRATFDQSWDRLAADEQQTFRQLSVFRGGFTRRAAEAVAGAELRILRALINRSFLSLDGDDRFQIHEMLRQYGAERLEASGEEEATRERHAAWCLTLAETAGPRVGGPDAATWLRQLAPEWPNLRAAANWALEREEPALVLRLSCALQDAVNGLGLGDPREARRWLDAALAMGDRADIALRIDALTSAAVLAGVEGDLIRAETMAQQALVLAQDHDVPPPGEADALHALGLAASFWGNLEQMEDFFARSLELRRAAGDRALTGHVLGFLADAALWQGDLTRAATLAEEARGLLAETGHQIFTSRLLGTLGAIALAKDDPTKAAQLYRDYLSLATAFGHTRYVADALAGIAGVALAGEDAEAAARLLGAAAAQMESVGARSMVHHVQYERVLAAARADLPEPAFTAAWAAGRALGREEAIAAGLAVTSRAERGRHIDGTSVTVG